MRNQKVASDSDDKHVALHAPCELLRVKLVQNQLHNKHLSGLHHDSGATELHAG